MKEKVLVIEKVVAAPLIKGKFTTKNLDLVLPTILKYHSFRDRDSVETNPGFKQIIPYVVVRHGDKFLLLRRTPVQAEARLHNKYSIGVGGHIKDTENLQAMQNVVMAGLERELEEEVHLHGFRRSLDLIGVIYDDSNAVGQVHLGLVFLLETENDQFTVNEPDQMTAEWADIQKLREYQDRMETWSQITFKHIAQQ